MERDEYQRVSELISRKEYEEKIARLTIQELEPFPEDRLVYRALGKAYLRADLNLVRASLSKVVSNAAGEKSKLQERLGELEASLVNK